ncbi:MAG: hypothetical protein WDZ62_00140 [Candidatus Pacearchaeota archaeon]
MKIIALLVIKFFFISALFVISNGNLYMTDSLDRQVFFDIYSEWLGDIFGQGVEVAGNVVNSQWLPENNFSYLEINS